MKQLRILLTLFAEAATTAAGNFRVHPLRTVLSLLGVTIGVFCISGIFTMVDSLEANIRRSVSKLGSDVLYVQRFPWNFSADYPWWKYVNRPKPEPVEAELLRRYLPGGAAVNYTMWMGGKTLQQGPYSVEQATVTATGFPYNQIFAIELAAGRYFSAAEAERGAPVTVLGHELAESLFPATRAVGRNIRALGGRLRVIGVLAPEGNSIISGNNLDQQALTPVTWVQRQYRLTDLSHGSAIMIKNLSQANLQRFKAEVRGAMRRIRKLDPREEANFALNEVSLINQALSRVFNVIGIVGSIIALFSILVGGFSIANILFVSVKERTPLIGIQKALGAPSSFIQVQFLIEAVMLCGAGGLLGLLMIGAMSLSVSLLTDFTLVVSLGNVLTGLGIALATGLLAGWWPSRQASKLDPVVAMRYTAA